MFHYRESFSARPQIFLNRPFEIGIATAPRALD
jgi:hypothetical protein